MHQVWPLLWVWEKAWSTDGLFPLVEHNQGAISVAALMAALVFFLVEQKRANDAEAEAKAAARTAELKEQEKVRIARIEARHAANAEKRRQVSEFVAVAIDLMDGFVARGREGLNEGILISLGFATVKTEIIGALRSLERTCPPDPALLRLLFRALAAIEHAVLQDEILHERQLYGSRQSVFDNTEASLGAIATALRERQRQLAKLRE